MLVNPKEHQKGKDKLSRIQIEVQRLEHPYHLKPKIRLRHNPRVTELKALLREQKLVTVCEEASCPNLHECFGNGTATFMIMGDKCTRRCSFCDVAHGRPDPLDQNEPKRLASTIAKLNLSYVVITSVDRDDLLDGGGEHFGLCIKAIRETCPDIKIEILVPDFKKRMERGLKGLSLSLPDVFNHNIETVPRLYLQARPGSDYHWSLKLLQTFKQQNPDIPTKSGLMLGLGERLDEVKEVLKDLRDHDVDALTLGQYLAPSKHHFPVQAYISKEEFDQLAVYAKSLGFSQVASGPLVRSSYHADKQASGEQVS
jgi:lipoyl synthase